MKCSFSGSLVCIAPKRTRSHVIHSRILPCPHTVPTAPRSLLFTHPSSQALPPPPFPPLPPPFPPSKQNHLHPPFCLPGGADKVGYSLLVLQGWIQYQTPYSTKASTSPMPAPIASKGLSKPPLHSCRHTAEAPTGEVASWIYLS